MQLSDIWVPAGVILGFQITWFTWRISREIRMEAKGETVWFPYCDWMNLTSIIFLVTGVFVFPILGITQFAQFCLGLALILLTGYPFALAGHYQLYKMKDPPRAPRSRFPYQERIPIIITSVIAIVYIIIGVLKQI